MQSRSTHTSTHVGYIGITIYLGENTNSIENEYLVIWEVKSIFLTEKGNFAV